LWHNITETSGTISPKYQLREHLRHFDKLNATLLREYLRHFDKLNATLLRNQSPSESVKGAFPSAGSETKSAVASNWVVAQNFLTRTALTENFLPVALANKSKLNLLHNPTNRVNERMVIFYPGFSLTGKQMVEAKEVYML